MNKIYFDNAASSLPNPRVLACAQRYVELYTTSEKSASDITRELRGYMVSAREQVARLINCDYSEVSLVQCTSHALGIIANAIPLEKGDNILICDLEYQASVCCWKPRINKIGVELREVKSHNGSITATDFERSIDSNTKAIVLASVQEINGFRADVKAISKLAHEHNCYIIIDGVQEVGAMRVDVKEYDVDFYCAGAKKWIGNPFGTGFLYTKMELIQQLEPMYYSYFNLKVPERFPDYISYLEDPSRHPFDDVGVFNDGTKFEIAAYANYLGALGLSEAIQVQLDYGTENIEKKILSLNERLILGLNKIGIKVCSPTERLHMSSIVAFNFGFTNGNIEKEKYLVNYLQERNIYVSLRSSTGTGGIRISIHYYNTEEQIDILVKNIESFMKEEGVTQL
jgi:cysteine desulfurase/selenocysteine lyase